MPSLLLVPSPLVGQATWEPVAETLRRDGHEAAVVDTSWVRRPSDLVAAVEAAAGGGDVLVLHSNAGLVGPILGDRLGLSGTVYVDAALPLGTGTTTAMAPEPLLDLLRDRVDDAGLLPPWTAWWDDLDGVFPDQRTRDVVEAGQPRLPLSYFTSKIEVPQGWTDRPAAYLAFGETYAEERALAEGCGWPTATLDGQHLHQLHDPAGVAAAVLDLLSRLRA